MAWSYTKTGHYVAGGMHFTYGTYTNSAATTGGTIDTGLSVTEFLHAQPVQAGVVASANAVNGTFPITGLVTLVTINGDDAGIWWAFGRK